MPNLVVEVHNRDITISEPSGCLSITYRKHGFAPMLVSLDDMRGGLSREQLRFVVQAWKAAFEKAKALGWLN